MSRDAFDYTTLYILVLSILCAAVAVPIFANEYQTGSDSILRCTKYGRMKLAVTRILAACCIFIIIFILGMSIHLLILNLAFGTDCLKTSFQMLFSIINLPNINLGQLQIILVFAGLLSLLATISCTLFLYRGFQLFCLHRASVCRIISCISFIISTFCILERQVSGRHMSF